MSDPVALNLYQGWDRKTVAITIIAFLVVLGTVATLVLTKLDVVLMALFGSRSFGDGLGRFSVGLIPRGIVVSALLVMLLSPVVLFKTLSAIEGGFELARKDQIERQRRAQELGTRLSAGLQALFGAARQRLQDSGTLFLIAQIADRQRQLEERGFRDVGHFRLISGEIAVHGSRRNEIGSTETETAEIHVLDPASGDEKLFVVVHLFDGTAYWKFRSANLFVTADDNSDFNLWFHLETPAAVAALSEFDFVAGLGLQSRTLETAEAFSRQRAGVLCAGLNAALSGSPRTEALGLDVGSYTGAAYETEVSRDPTQRPVVLVGIDVIDQSADYQGFVRELLKRIKLSGLDIGLFENLLPGRNAEWLRPPTCIEDYAFLDSPQDDVISTPTADEK